MGKIHVHEHWMYYRTTYVKIELSIMPLFDFIKTNVDWTIDKILDAWLEFTKSQIKDKANKVYIQHCFSLKPLANCNDFFGKVNK